MRRLIDFGFAKVLRAGAKTFTLCGTPQYLAPEIVTSAGHGLSVDCWAFGVLMFEMLHGHTPFDGEELLAYSPYLPSPLFSTSFLLSRRSIRPFLPLIPHASPITHHHSPTVFSHFSLLIPHPTCQGRPP